MSKKSKEQDNNIITNRKAFHDYFLEEHFEAGIALEGWEAFCEMKDFPSFITIIKNLIP